MLRNFGTHRGRSLELLERLHAIVLLQLLLVLELLKILTFKKCKIWIIREGAA